MSKDERSSIRIDQIRENLRMTIALRNQNSTAVSRKAGLSTNALGSFIRGNTSISHLNLLKVCDVLDVPIQLLDQNRPITAEKIRFLKSVLELPDHLVPEVYEFVEATAIRRS